MLPPEGNANLNLYACDIFNLGQLFAMMLCNPDDIEAFLNPKNFIDDAFHSLMLKLSDIHPSTFNLVKSLLDPNPFNRPSIFEIQRETYFSSVYNLVREYGQTMHKMPVISD